jgi:hypothetical protein
MAGLPGPLQVAKRIELAGRADFRALDPLAGENANVFDRHHSGAELAALKCALLDLILAPMWVVLDLCLVDSPQPDCGQHRQHVAQ